MNGLPAILDVIIGLSFVYLLLSLICSAAVEYVELISRKRGYALYLGLVDFFAGAPDDDDKVGVPEREEQAIGSESARHAARSGPAALAVPNVQSESGAAFVRKLYNNPLIFPLYRGSLHFESRWRPRNLPSYLPPRVFVEALIDTLRGDVESGVPRSGPIKESAELIALIRSAKSLPASVKQVLETVLTPTESYEAAVKRLEDWFITTTQGVAEGYRQLSQWRAAVVAFVIVVALNVDTVSISHSLQIDEELRTHLVNQAAAFFEAQATSHDVAESDEEARPRPEPQPISDATASERSEAEGAADSDTVELDHAMAKVRALRGVLDSLGLPIGWSRTELFGCEQTTTEHDRLQCHDPIKPAGSWYSRIGSHLPGWLITAIAVSFGAPLWFDLLNRIMTFRTALKRDDDNKSRD